MGVAYVKESIMKTAVALVVACVIELAAVWAADALFGFYAAAGVCVIGAMALAVGVSEITKA